MITYEELTQTKEWQLVEIQTSVFNLLNDYMKKEGLNQTQLAEHLGVSKSYVSQILNGDFDYRVSKLIELALAVGYVPKLSFEPIDKQETVLPIVLQMPENKRVAVSV